MDDLLVALRLVLAAVFVVAAAGKWTDRSGTRTAARNLGAPASVARVVPIVLPVVEVVLAAALIPVSSAPWAAAALFGLVTIFTVMIAATLARGRRPSCHCFGALDAEPISRWTLARNALLLGALGFVAVAGRRPRAEVFAGEPWIDLVALVGLVLLGWGVARRPSASAPGGDEAAVHLPGSLAVGDRAPEFVLPALDGRSVSLAELRARHLPTVLLFANATCGSCTSLLPDIERWQAEHVEVMTVVLVLSSPEAGASVKDDYDIDPLLVEHGRGVTELFGPLPAPSAVVVGPDGAIASEVAAGADAIRELVDRIAGRQVTSYQPPEATRALVGAPPPVAPGTLVPDFHFPSLAGPVLTPRGVRSGPAVYVFVQDRCSHCGELLDQLASQPDLVARAVIITAGGTLRVSAEHLPCPVLVDRLGLLLAALGIAALPSAIVVEDHVVTSPLVSGVEDILDLLREIDPEPIAAIDITEDFVPRPHPATVTISVDGTTVIGDPEHGRFHTLDGPGGLIWSWFDGTEPLHSIAEEISSAVGAPLDVVHQDVMDFTRRLGDAGVLDGVAAAPIIGGDYSQGSDTVTDSQQAGGKLPSET